MQGHSNHPESNGDAGRGECPVHRAAKNRRRALKALMIFGPLCIGALIVRRMGERVPEEIFVAAGFVQVVGFLGTAWWLSVLYDAGGFRRRS